MTTMGEVSEGLTQADLANIASFLLGGVLVDTGRDPAVRNVTNYSAGILRRLTENFPGDPCGFQRITTLGTVQILTVPAVANSCILTVEAQPVRVTFDGTRPTATVGHLYGIGTALQVSGVASVTALQVLENVAGGIIQVSYFT